MGVTNTLRVGTILYGYCAGYFGSSYLDKRVEAIGADWVVAREENGAIVFAEVDPPESLLPFTKREVR